MASNYSEVVYEASEMELDDDDIKVVPATSDLLEEECSRKHDLFKTPACLIYTDDKGLLEIDGNVLSQLSQIDKKISVVGICGLYRSGKSYLMNLIAGEKRGFKLGNTVQSETKGIWIWCKNHPTKEDTVLVLIDTEGLNDPKKGDPEHDNNLFCLTLLICSTLIINVKGVFDYDTLDKLAFIGSLADCIKLLDGDEADKHNANMISVASPRLVVCIRDFHLQNIKDGKQITPDEDLEDNLKPVESTNSQQIKYNKTKQTIKDYFPKRKCFTLAQPAMGDALQNIESLDDNAIDQKFLQDLETLKKYIYDRKPKHICNASKKPIDGADLATLMTSYVKNIRESIPIVCEDAYTQVAKEKNDRVLKKIMKNFEIEMKKGENMTKKEKLQDIFLKVHEKTLTKYREESFLYLQDEFEEKIKEQMLSHFNRLQENLKTRCQTFGADKVSKMYNEMLKMKRKTYTSPDGYEHYEKDMEILQDRFFEEMKAYDKDDLCVAFEELKKREKDDRMAIFRFTTANNAHKFEKLIEQNRKMMDEKYEHTLQLEAERKVEYMRKEMESLKIENDKMSELLNKKKRKLCPIM